MSYSSRQIDREVYGAVGETCPHIDKALNDASENIKIQTGLLRDALREYAERALNAEDQLEKAHSRIAELESQVSELEAELSSIDE